MIAMSSDSRSLGALAEGECKGWGVRAECTGDHAKLCHHNHFVHKNCRHFVVPFRYMSSYIPYMHVTLSILTARHWMYLFVIDNVCTFDGGKLKFVMG